MRSACRLDDDGVCFRKDCLLLFTERLHENVFERFTYRDSYNEEQICLTIRQLASALHWIHFKGYASGSILSFYETAHLVLFTWTYNRTT